MMSSSLLESLDPFLEPARLCQGFFVLASAGILAVAATPASARRLLTQYGARSAPATAPKGDMAVPEPDTLTKLIGWVTSVGRVPHWWFIHFYVLSVSSSLFWAVQYLRHGSVLQTIAEYQADRSTATTTLNQVVLVWLMMALQGIRRLYECLFVMRTSSSEMWIVHWLLGCAYYLAIGIAVWIEGSWSILQAEGSSFDVEPPSPREMVGLGLFLLAWCGQHACHKHLAGLKKYSLPHAGMFRSLVCPHYTCECVLYLSMAITAAPEGQLCNQTLLCGVLFVAANLGVTAGGTRRWYASKFGKEAVRQKWNMIPLLY